MLLSTYLFVLFTFLNNVNVFVPLKLILHMGKWLLFIVVIGSALSRAIALSQHGLSVHLQLSLLALGMAGDKLTHLIDFTKDSEEKERQKRRRMRK